MPKNLRFDARRGTSVPYDSPTPDPTRQLQRLVTEERPGACVGCWFCHNQGVDQLRLLRRNHPELWALMLKWDADSPVTFHADGHTVHDYDDRFRMEDDGLIPENGPFRWSVLDETQLTADWYITHGGDHHDQR